MSKGGGGGGGGLERERKRWGEEDEGWVISFLFFLLFRDNLVLLQRLNCKS
ncbi:hypothetical protein HanIR_Chr05g0242781 [Helianthus annuus]|nr:hypothetical protein HanIR_Chr05g0242781 [Helianthus annuus]